MPYSSSEGKPEAVEFVQALDAHTVIDIGPGAGTWFDLLHPLWPRAIWECVEIWRPYVERFSLRQKYDRVHIADALRIPLYSLRGSYDLAIFGDVIEHMAKGLAVHMVERIPWKRALISVPIVEYPQGPYEGNPYEEHIATWSAKDVCEAFTVTKQWTGAELGVFLCEH